MARIKFDDIRLFALDILFPSRCPFCGDFIMWNELCCGACRDTLASANDVICRNAGRTNAAAVGKAMLSTWCTVLISLTRSR